MSDGGMARQCSMFGVAPALVSRVGAIVVGTALLVSCGGGGELPPERPLGTVNGYAVDGAIANGTVSIYALTATGPGKLLGQTTTDARGAFSIAVQAASQPVLLDVQGGSYIEDADNTEVELRAGAGLQAVGMYKSGEDVVFNITPLTHIAAALAQYRVGGGEAFGDAIASSNREVSQIFGIDVVGTAPRSIREAADARTLGDPMRYGFVLAALSSYTQWIGERSGTGGHEQYPTYEFARLMGQDIGADGTLDGRGAIQGNGQPTALKLGDVPLNQDTYRSAIAQHVLVAANAPFNKTGLTQADVESVAAAVLGASSPVLVVGSPLQLVIDASRVGFIGDQASYYSGVVSFGIVVDGNVSIDGVKFEIDGKEAGIAASDTTPSVALDTRALSDGRHTITARVRDDGGAERSAEFNLLADNSAPTVKITSASVTNLAEFELTGTHAADGAPVSRIWVGGGEAQLNSAHEWHASVRLVSGINTVPITVIDSAGNEVSTSTVVKLDVVPPVFRALSYKSDVLFALGGGTCYRASLQDASDSGQAIYFDRNRMAIGQGSYNAGDLDALGIPYIRFAAEDLRVAGVYTPADQLAVSWSYERDGQTMLSGKPLSLIAGTATETSYYLVPLASDFLPVAWASSVPSSVHRIRIAIRDEAGNSPAPLELRFRAEFGNGACATDS